MNDIRNAQDRFLSRRFGIFNHFLYGNPSDTAVEAANSKPLNWDKCIEDFDAEDMARRLHEVGAGYYCITVMQGSKHMLAPNAAYDRIAGTQPGDACPRRDLIMDLANALAKYDIDLYLYFTGDGPHLDEVIGPRFGYSGGPAKVTKDFVLRWAEVLKEYSLRYGEKVKGWWVDGCYRMSFGYNDEMLALLYDACKAGNPAALVAMNNGLEYGFEKNYSRQEFVGGEFSDFTEFPPARFIDGAQAHILAPIGLGRDDDENHRWRTRGAHRSAEYMLDYVRRANAAGMPVTIDTYVGHDGSWDQEQYDLLKYIGDALAGE